MEHIVEMRRQNKPTGVVPSQQTTVGMNDLDLDIYRKMKAPQYVCSTFDEN